MYKSVTNEKLRVFSSLIAIVFLASLSVGSGAIALLIGATAFVFGIYKIIKSSNIDGSAHLYASFIVACDVFFRMTGSGLPWEFGKYGATVLLTIGMIVEGRKSAYPFTILLYMFLLLPASYIPFSTLDFITARETVMFNLAGPLLLMISTMYFYNRKFSYETYVQLSRWFLSGILMMSIYILITVGDYSSVSYSLGSNADSSGGFSATQVAPMFAVGILVLLINLFQNRTIFIYKVIDVFLLFLFLIQAFFTFSRGGLLSAVLALSFAIVLSNSLSVKKFFMGIVLPSIFVVLAFSYVDNISGGNMYKRYFNKDEDGSAIKSDLTTGRGGIVASDLKTFQKNIFGGVGVGGAMETRFKDLGTKYASHNEYARVLAEHGMLGLLSQITLLLIGLLHFFKAYNKTTTMIYIAFFLFSLLEMTHGAMRLAMISFMFGLAFIIVEEKEPESAV